MTYSVNCPAADLVCEVIGWDPHINAIRAFRRGSTVYATGTLLKPHEWRELKRHDGRQLDPATTLRLTRVPPL